MGQSTNSGVQQVPFVDLQAQYGQIASEVNEAMAAVLTKADFVLGAAVEQFETAFADYCGSGYGVGVDSGLSALELLLRAHEIGPGDEVITVANTFIATGLAISAVGATPVLVDADPATYQIDVAQIEAAITARTKAIMPVHLYGHVAEMDPIMAIAERHNLLVLEDASQAHGARYKGRRVGSLGHAAAFSLYPAKNLGAYGDAGVIVTNDQALVQRLRLLRNYGAEMKYHHVIAGHNHRLDTLHAAVLGVKLRYLDGWNAARRTLAQQYTELLQDSSVTTPVDGPHEEPVHHLYVIRSSERDALQAHLEAQGIATVIHYPIPMHLQPAYQHLGYVKGDFPVTEQYSRQILSLPIYPELTTTLLTQVVTAIKAFDAEHLLNKPTLLPASSAVGLKTVAFPLAGTTVCKQSPL